MLLTLHNCDDLNKRTYENFHQQYNIFSTFILLNLNHMSDSTVVELQCQKDKFRIPEYQGDGQDCVETRCTCYLEVCSVVLQATSVGP